MSNLTTTPLQDNYETVLTQEWDGLTGTIFVADAPDFTFPGSDTTYIVVDAGTTNAQLAEINAVDTALNTITVSNITGLELGEGISSTTKVHSTNARVLISDNFQFWKDNKTAVNSKLGNDGSNSTTTFDLTVSGSAWRLRKDGNDMKFTDDNNSEISLTTIAAAAGVDEKVKITLSDTTAGTLDAKLTAGDGLTKTTINPAGNESLDLDIDLITTNGLKFTTNQLDIEPATNTQVGTQRISTDAEATAGSLETVSINPKQLEATRGVAILQTSRLITTASSTENIAHGLGVIPRYVEIRSVHRSGNSSGLSQHTSDGFSDGTLNKSTNIFSFDDGSSVGISNNNDASNCIFIQSADSSSSPGDVQSATITLDATNISIVWVFSGTGGPGTGTVFVTFFVHA